MATNVKTIQLHCQGNLYKEEALKIFDYSLKKLKCLGTKSLLAKMVAVPNYSEPTCLKIQNFNKNDGNGYVFL